MIFNLVLFLIWTFLAAAILVVPHIAGEHVPKWINDSPLVGYLAIVMAFWNLNRWWSIRAYNRRKQEQAAMEVNYLRRVHPTESLEEKKPVLHPEFKFDDERSTPPTATPGS